MLTVSPRGKNVSGCCGIGNARKRCLKDTQLQSARLRVILGPLAPPGDRAVQEKRARDAKTPIQSFERHSKLHYGRRRARDAAAARAAVASTASYTQLRRRRVSPPFAHLAASARGRPRGAPELLAPGVNDPVFRAGSKNRQHTGQ